MGGGSFEDFLIHTQENTQVRSLQGYQMLPVDTYCLILLGFEPRSFDIQIQHSTDQATIGLIKLKIKGEGYRG